MSLPVGEHLILWWNHIFLWKKYASCVGITFSCAESHLPAWTPYLLNRIAISCGAKAPSCWQTHSLEENHRFLWKPPFFLCRSHTFLFGNPIFLWRNATSWVEMSVSVEGPVFLWENETFLGRILHAVAELHLLVGESHLPEVEYFLPMWKLYFLYWNASSCAENESSCWWTNITVVESELPVKDPSSCRGIVSSCVGTQLLLVEMSLHGGEPFILQGNQSFLGRTLFLWVNSIFLLGNYNFLCENCASFLGT